MLYHVYHFVHRIHSFHISLWMEELCGCRNRVTFDGTSVSYDRSVCIMITSSVGRYSIPPIPLVSVSSLDTSRYRYFVDTILFRKKCRISRTWNSVCWNPRFSRYWTNPGVWYWNKRLFPSCVSVLTFYKDITVQEYLPRVWVVRYIYRTMKTSK